MAGDELGLFMLRFSGAPLLPPSDPAGGDPAAEPEAAEPGLLRLATW